MAPSVRITMQQSLNELDVKAAICMQQARQELLIMASICDESNTYLRKLMEDDIDYDDVKRFWEFTEKAEKIMDRIMRKGDASS